MIIPGDIIVGANNKAVYVKVCALVEGCLGHGAYRRLSHGTFPCNFMCSMDERYRVYPVIKAGCVFKTCYD